MTRDDVPGVTEDDEGSWMVTKDDEKGFLEDGEG